MRVLHFSDVHVDVPPGELPWRELLNKRLLGLANHQLRRGKHFAGAREKLRALGAFAEAQAVDVAICTGDYTVLGTDPELRAARQAVAGLTGLRSGYVTVPGNHDLYMPDTLRDHRFERHFGEFMRTDVPEYSVDGLWPMVRFVGDEIAVVAVQSVRPNPQPWRSSGRVRDSELKALDKLLQDPRIERRFTFIITHYAPRRADGTPDSPLHGLENADAFLAACGALRHGAILHGHIHWRYHLAPASGRPAIFGSGSTTCDQREGLWLFDVDGAQVRAYPGGWTGSEFAVDAASVVTL